MIGDIELKSDNLEGFMSVCVLSLMILWSVDVAFQLWLENESGMASLNSVFKRFSSAVSGVYIALFGQTLTQARLNCITGYDQSNELFKACFPELPPISLLGVDDFALSGRLS